MPNHDGLTSLTEILNEMIVDRHLPVDLNLSEDKGMLTILPKAARRSAAQDDTRKNSPRNAPEGKSFELSVLLRTISERAIDQRMIFPTEAATSLKLDSARSGIWTLQGASGDEIVTRLAIGTSMTTQEANELLATVEATLAPLLRVRRQ